ncbi:MAG TPA: hypothetical protein VF628_11975 [Allosphingosinicella sp.]
MFPLDVPPEEPASPVYQTAAKIKAQQDQAIAYWPLETKRKFVESVKPGFCKTNHAKSRPLLAAIAAPLALPFGGD